MYVGILLISLQMLLQLVRHWINVHSLENDSQN